ncbi:hypothetical protein COV11_03885, partial [Candidatus Woesearchaeota archaeon CG10_big_fil_rev_8_21_14_0_10_30_7]
MKQFLVLERTNLELSKAEALAVCKPRTKNYRQIDNLLILNNKKDLSRLALTKAVYKFLFISERKDFKKTIQKFDWQKEYKNNFRVRVHNYENEKEIADLVW